MKIITNEAIYVQKKDIVFLIQTDLSMPVSIFLKVFGNGIIIIDNTNRYEFVKFEEESEIEFFKNQDWIVDYNSLKDLDESQIIELGQEVAQQKNEIATQYNAMTNDERKENEHMFLECERLDFKMYSLRDILWFKQGYLKFDLPDSKKGLRRILSKFKKNNK